MRPVESRAIAPALVNCVFGPKMDAIGEMLPLPLCGYSNIALPLSVTYSRGPVPAGGMNVELPAFEPPPPHAESARLRTREKMGRRTVNDLIVDNSTAKVLRST